MRKLILLAILLVFSGCSHKYARVRVTWNEPTSGSEVTQYILQMKTDNESWNDAHRVGPIPMWVGNLPRNHEYYFRVVGVDSLNRMGYPSPVSDVLLLLPK